MVLLTTAGVSRTVALARTPASQPRNWASGSTQPPFVSWRNPIPAFWAKTSRRCSRVLTGVRRWMQHQEWQLEHTQSWLFDPLLIQPERKQPLRKITKRPPAHLQARLAERQYLKAECKIFVQ